MEKPNEMKFTKLLSNLIVENKTQFLHDKYVYEPKKGEKADPKKKIMPFGIFKEIIKADPTTKFPQGFNFETATPQDIKDKVKAGGYSEWIIKSFFNLVPSDGNVKPGTPEYNREMGEKIRLFVEDLFKINGDLVKFIKYKQYFPEDKRDIGRFSSPDELYRFISEFQLPEKKQKELEKKELKKEIRKEREGYKHPGAKIVFTGDKWTVIKIEGDTPESRDAASWYGGYYDETRWCTSPPNSNHFRHYITKGPLYVILPNDDKGNVGKRTGLPVERYQWHFEDEQFMDKDDRQIDVVKFLTDEGSELKEFFKPMFLSGKGNEADATTIEIKTSSRKGKILAIYGFNELFENLNTNLTKLTIINDSSANIEVDIPSSIGDLVNLETLTLSGIVKSLPESIGNCKNIYAMSLNGNKNLKSLPESILNLTELQFINVKDCSPSLKLSKGFEEKFELIQSGLWYRISD